MSEQRNDEFAHEIGEAFKRELGFRYQGPQRGYVEGLSFALAESFARGTGPTKESSDAIANELMDRGWATNLAGAISQGLLKAALANDYAPLTSRLATEAQQGSIAAQLSLGKLYCEGWAGLPTTPGTAAELYRQAAEKGDSTAQYNLGLLYCLGSGVEQSFALAAKWFTCASAQGHVDAQFMMGMLYYCGQGVEQSYPQAAQLYQQCAEQGDAEAQCYLGFMYSVGRGCPLNEELAEHWWTASAQQEYPNAQFKLGCINQERGRYADARHWYEQSAKNGFAEARIRLDQLERDDDTDRAWSPEKGRSEHPNVIYSDTTGKLHPAPGYRWVSDEAGDFRVRWTPGREHSSDHSHVIASDTESMFRPSPGYAWCGAVGDLRVQWRPGKKHSQQHPNVIASDTEGIFCPASGYTWIDGESDDPGVTPLAPDQACVERARSAVRRQDWDAAIVACTEALQIKPNNIDALKDRGSAFFMKKMYDHAMADFTKIKTLDASDVWAWKQQGRVYRERELNNEAVACFTSAIRLDPKDPEAYACRADAYLMLGARERMSRFYDMAISDCTRAIQMSSDYDWAHHVRGLCFHEKGHYASAIADYQAAIRKGSPVASEVQRYIAAASQRKRIGE